MGVLYQVLTVPSREKEIVRVYRGIPNRHRKHQQQHPCVNVNRSTTWHLESSLVLRCSRNTPHERLTMVGIVPKFRSLPTASLIPVERMRCPGNHSHEKLLITLVTPCTVVVFGAIVTEHDKRSVSHGLFLQFRTHGLCTLHQLLTGYCHWHFHQRRSFYHSFSVWVRKSNDQLDIYYFTSFQLSFLSLLLIETVSKLLG